MKLSPEAQDVVVVITLFTTLGVGYLIGKSSVKTEWREVVSIVEKTGKTEDLQPGGYGYYDPIWKTIFTSHGDIDEARKYIEKKNAQRFIDDHPERVEMVELFYRKVK